MDIAVLDFSKAFDTVPHNHLLTKLKQYGIAGTTLTWIREFLTNRTQRVLVEGHGSRLSVRSGVPQGTVLGPLLLFAFINDLPHHVQSQIRLFADDCLLYRPICDVSDSVALQSHGQRRGVCYSILRSAISSQLENNPDHSSTSLMGVFSNTYPITLTLPRSRALRVSNTLRPHC